MYQDIYNCICQNTHTKKRFIIHYVKPTAQLLFKIRFSKGGPTCRRQVVNPRHQTPQGQSVAKPETPLQNIQVEFLGQLDVELMDWSAQSPDINSTEHVWGQTGVWIRDMDDPPSTRPELWRAAHQVWAVCPRNVRTLVERMSCSVYSLLVARGGHDYKHV